MRSACVPWVCFCLTLVGGCSRVTGQPHHSTGGPFTQCALSVHGNPIDPERGCVDTATFERLGCADDPRNAKRRFPNGELAVSACVRRVSDGRIFSSPVPVAALPSGQFEACSDAEPFEHCSCEFSECSIDRQIHFEVACSAEDYCWSVRVAHPASAAEAPDTELACDAVAAPTNQQCSYTPEGACACSRDSTARALLPTKGSIVATQ